MTSRNAHRPPLNCLPVEHALQRINRRFAAFLRCVQDSFKGFTLRRSYMESKPVL